MPRPEVPDRPSKPLEKEKRRVAFSPTYVWLEWDEEIEIDGKPATVPRRARALPASARVAAEEMETEIRARLVELELPLPRPGAVRDRVLHVAELVPVHQQQRIVAVVKEVPPFWGVTTELIRG